MSTTIVPPQHCRQTFDHAAHHWNYRWSSNPAERTDFCPGRYNAQPSDPFAGIDENTESDARRPAVS